MARSPLRGIDSRRKKTVLEKGQPYYSTDTGSMWIGDGKTRGGVPAPWRGHNDLPDSAYDDMVVDANSVSATGGAVITTTTWLSVLRVLNLVNGGLDYGYFSMQLPHGYVPGSDLHWHIHFTNPAPIAATETVAFVLTFSKAAVWGVFPAVATVTATFTNDEAARDKIRKEHPASLSGTSIVANTHLIAGGATISGAGLSLSSILYGRVERATGAADTHGGDIYLLSADAHIRKNRFGTEREYS